jgi:ABC-type Fe3+ transport system substrate-binding protein
MADLFAYNSGSLFQALNPASQLQPLNDEPWVDQLAEAFKPAVSVDDQVYGAPFGAASGGGILYNKNVYEKLGLEVPMTWDEFMANNAKIKAAGIDPVIQSYGETWTSQLFVLADYHNVAAEDPEWDKKYTSNQVKYAQEPAIEGFKHLEEVNKAGYLNKNYGSIKFPAALSLLAQGKGAHYPQLTFTVPNIETSDPGKVDDVGFFAQPGESADDNGLTLWLPGAVYVPKTVEGAKLDAAKKFLAFVASPEGCEVQAAAFAPSGPFMLQGCEGDAARRHRPPAVTVGEEERVPVLVLPAGLRRLLRLLPAPDVQQLLLQPHALDAVRLAVDRARELPAVLPGAGAHQGPDKHADIRGHDVRPEGNPRDAARGPADVERDRPGLHALGRLLPRAGEHDRGRPHVHGADGARRGADQ